MALTLNPPIENKNKRLSEVLRQEIGRDAAISFVLLPRPGAKLLGNHFDEDLVETLVQNRCSSSTQSVDRRSALAIDVLEDRLTEPQRPVIATLVNL